MTNETLSRKRFLQGTAAVGGGLAMSGPLAALAAESAHGRTPRRAVGYGPLRPTAAQDTGVVHIALPEGFRYRVIARQGDPSFAFDDNGNRQTVPMPNVLDGMGAFPGPGNQTILILNHEHRQSAGEIPVIVPSFQRYDPNPVFVAGNTRLVVAPNRTVRNITHVLGGTSVNCAGGVTPWNSWISCEETFIAEGQMVGGAPARKHGYCFEIDAAATGPDRALPIRAAGAFAHEAVVFHQGILYETEDNGKPSGFYRYRPTQRPRRSGDLARSTGPLEALAVRGRPNFDLDEAARPGETFSVAWAPIADPDPATNTVRLQAATRAWPCSAAWRAAGWAAGRSTSTPPTEGPPGTARCGSTIPGASC